MDPVQTPDTSVVTRVRSIQSFCAQPLANTQATAITHRAVLATRALPIFVLSLTEGGTDQRKASPAAWAIPVTEGGIVPMTHHSVG